MIAHLLLIPALLLWPADEDGLARSGVSDRDLTKMSKDVNAFFEALDEDDRQAQVSTLGKLESALAKAAKKAKVDGSLLAYTGDWDFLLETSKSPGRDLTSNYGRGFFRHVFADPWDPEGRRVVSLLSIPAVAKGGAILPAIVSLKHTVGQSGKKLEEQLGDEAAAAYGSLSESHIILIPIGLESGEGRKAETTELDESWVGDAGMYVFFTAYRTLLEQLPFDRTRVVLDGWADAGTDALRLATTTPFFSGLLLRSSPVESSELIYSNLATVPVMYLKGTGDEAPDSVDVLTGADGVDAEVVELGTSALSPDAEALGSVATWLEGCRRDPSPTEFEYKLGDVRFGSINWCTATNINRRVTAQPGDADFPRIQARIDRGTNTIEIECVNVLEMFVYLSDSLVNLDKPVTIKVNGEEKVSRKMIKRSLRDLLETRFFNNSGDYGLYTASERIEEIDANLPGGD